MTIQPSITVWTVICFSALFFILHFLLFKPILKQMDEREEKITNAKKEKEAAILRRDEKRRLFISEQEKAKKQLIANQEKEAEKLRLEVKKQLEDAKAEHFLLLEEYRQKTEKEFAGEIENSESATDYAADLFFVHLFKN